MNFAVKVVLNSLAVLLVLYLTPVSSVGFPGISWGWKADSETHKKTVTSPEVIQHFPLPYPFRQCSVGMEGVMTTLLLYPCIGDKSGRCMLTPGQNITLDLEFISNIPATKLLGSLSIIFTRWFSPISLGEPQDLCKSELINCPIQPLVRYHYRTSIYVRPTLPSLAPDIRVVIAAENGREIACAVVPVTILGLEREPREVMSPNEIIPLAI